MDRISVRSPIFLLGILSVLLQSCAQQGALTNEKDTDAYLAESVVSSINIGLSDAERSQSLTARLEKSTPNFPQSFFALLNEKAKKMTGFRSIASAPIPGSCGVSRYSPSLGGGSCAATPGGQVVTSNYNCGIFEAQDQQLSGSITTTFSSPDICNTWLTSIPTTGSFVDTTSTFVRTTLDNSIITTFTDSSPNYNQVSIGGGVSVGFGAGTNSVAILGLKKTRVSSLKATLYEHSVHTQSAIVATGSLAAGSRAIASGTVIVDHNLDDFTATGVISDLKWSTTCCLPVSGTIDFTLTGKRIGQALVDFNTGTCGEVKLSGSAEVTPPPTKASPTPSPTASDSVVTQTIGGCE